MLTNTNKTYSAIKTDKTTKIFNQKDLNNFIHGSKSSELSSYLNNIKQMSTASTSSSNDQKPNLTVIDLGKLMLQSARDGETNKVHELISRGAPFTSDWLGMTPLHFAALHNHEQICEVLLRGGINKDAKTKVDRTPLHLATFEGHQSIVELLVTQKCDINAKDMLKMTPLHWAIEKKHKTIAKILLKNGADVDSLSKFGKTPISLAIQSGQIDLLDDLNEARENFKNIQQIDNEEHQSETNQAVNSITFDNQQLDNDIYELPPDPPKNCNEDNKANIQKNIQINNRKKLNETNPTVKPEVQNYEDANTLEMLKSLKSMLPGDDPEKNDVLVSALQNGRKLVLSEGGRLALNEAKTRQTTETHQTTNNNVIVNNHNNRRNSLNENKMDNENNKKLGAAAMLLKAKGMPLKSGGKNIKIITMDTFKKLYGKDAVKTMKKIHPNNIIKAPLSNQPSTSFTKFTKITNLNEINARKAIFGRTTTAPGPTSTVSSSSPSTQTPPTNTTTTTTLFPHIRFKTEPGTSPNFHQQQQPSNRNNNNDDDDDLPPNIEVCGDDSDDTQIENLMNIRSSKIRKISTTNQSANITTNNNNNSHSHRIQIQHPTIPILDIPEICRQLHDLKRQNEILRNDLDITRQENEDYLIRLERLENNFETLAEQ